MGFNNSKILLTGSENLSKQVAKTLEKRNLSTIIQPLFSIVELDNFQPISQELQAILITSQSAIFALEKLSIPKNILLFVIGKKTAEKVRKSGYENVIIANDSSASLLILAKEKLVQNQGLVLYLAGEEINLDLAEELQKNGFLAKKIIVYKTQKLEKFFPSTIEEIKAGNVVELRIYSQNSLKIFCELAKKDNLLECFFKIKILCLSKSIADLAKKTGFLKVKIMRML